MSVISAVEVENASGDLTIGAKDVLTPLAADRAKELGIRIRRAAGDRTISGAMPASVRRTNPVVLDATGLEADHVSGALYRRGRPIPPAMAVEAIDAASAVADVGPNVAIVGAGHVGAMTALRLSETSLFDRTTLIDIVPGLAAGLALDMWHSAALRGFTTRIEGSTELSALAGADFIVVTAGRPRQPGMSRTDLTGVNAEIIRDVAAGIRLHAPDAVVVVVTNPLEEMTHLMAMQTGFPAHKVIGMAGVLDSARFCSLVALTGIARPQDVKAIALGSHGAEMVIPLSQATANGQPLDTLLPDDKLSSLVERARDSGAEVVKLLEKGSAYFSPAESAATMVAAMVRDSSDVVAACVQSQGAYGIADTRIGLPVRLGRQGVSEVVTLPLRHDERFALTAAADNIAARIRQLD